MTLESNIISTLKTFIDSSLYKDSLSEEILQSLRITPSGQISFVLDVKTGYMEEGLKLKEEVESLLKSIPGVTKVHIALTTQRALKEPLFSKKRIPGVTYIIAIASGKGGVGKSTTAINLACALRTLGLKIGVLDADIYGPSLPRLLGTYQKPTSEDGKTMIPVEAHGLKSMSMGFLIDEKAPTIWRGPMIQKAFQQMLFQVAWGSLDVLVIDLPPGTGDVHLTLAQSVLVSGVIIVSTPQDLALIDARKGVEMFQKVDVPILGFVENMSYFLCPHCEARSDIFEHGGVHKEAQRLGMPLLAEIPLHMDIRETSERGVPLIIAKPHSPETKIYTKLAMTVWETLKL